MRVSLLYYAAHTLRSLGRSESCSKLVVPVGLLVFCRVRKPRRIGSLRLDVGCLDSSSGSPLYGIAGDLIGGSPSLPRAEHRADEQRNIVDGCVLMDFGVGEPGQAVGL